MDMNIKPLPKSLEDAIAKCPLIIGIGPSAWPRVISGYYFPKFKIICFNDCQDNDLIRKAGIEVFSQKKVDPDLEISPLTPGNIVSTDLAKKFLDEQNTPFVFQIYKSVGKFEKVCEENGWKFIGNKREIRDQYEDKRVFKEIIRKLGLEAIPGENIPIRELTEEKVEFYQKTLGQKKLVLQIAEATWGGGSGTFYIEDKRDVTRFHERVKEIRKALASKKKKMKTVNVAPFIEGISCSIPACATKHGVFTGSIQTQIVDIPEVGAKLPTRSGVFVGHDWAFRDFGEEAQKQATHIGRIFGDYLYKNGYRGLFGLDLIVDTKGKVWPVECNPRETDAFPLICMLQMEKGTPPMQVFHNLEGLGIDYQVDFEEIDAAYKKKYEASQILIYNKSPEFMVDRAALTAGVYKLVDGKLEFIRSGFAVWDLQSEDEFLLTEDISKTPGVVYDPHERMVRLIKKGGALKDELSLKEDVVRAAQSIYKKMKLVPVEYGLKNRKGLKVLFSKKLINVKKSKDLVKVDVVNVLRNTGSGFYRPMSISWRKKLLPGKSILEQMPSKRAKKHIKTDSEKIKSGGIEIKVVDEISDEYFAAWLKLYRKLIGSKEKGEVMVEGNWLAKKREKGKRVGAVLASKNGELIGGELFFDVNGRLGVQYGVAEKVEGLAGSLTLILDYAFLEFAQDKGYGEVSFGQDTNLYGYDLSPGLISYKEKFGFYPVPANKTYWVSTYFRSFDKFDGDVSFFVGGDGGLTLQTISNFDKKEVLMHHKPYLNNGPKDN